MINNLNAGTYLARLITASVLAGLVSSAAADALISPRVVDRVRSRTVEVLANGQMRGGGGIVSSTGSIITAGHLLQGANCRIEVILPEIGRRNAALVAIDPGHDLALLQVELKKGETVEPLKIATAIPHRGERLFCFGPGLRNLPLMLSGMVAEDREVYAEYTPFDAYLGCYLVDGAAPSLMSGGVWTNDDGDIVGVQNGRLNDDGMHPGGITMVAPPDAIRTLVAARTDTPTAGLGAWGWELWTAAPEHIARHPQGTEGVIITFIRKGGPVDKAGIPMLDVITHVDGQAVSRRADFVGRLRAHKPGDEVKLRVLDASSKAQEYTVKLEDVGGRWRGKAKEPDK